MKLILTTVIAATLATGAFAGNSDRYNDLRLDTSIGHVSVETNAIVLKPQSRPVGITLSSSNKSKGKTYAYINPYGVGPNNDSR